MSNQMSGEFGLIEVHSPVNSSTQNKDVFSDPVELVVVRVVVSVVHCAGQVEVTQVFVNTKEYPIDTIYHFPADSSFSGELTSFQTELEGRTIQHDVTASAAEKSLAANEQNPNTPGLFKVKIGLLSPGSQVKIIIGYVLEVKNDLISDSTLRFVLPRTTIVPFCTGKLINQKSLNKILATIKVSVSTQGTITSIVSPTHTDCLTASLIGPVEGLKLWTKAVAEFNNEASSDTSTFMKRDFVLLIKHEEINGPRLYLEQLPSSLAAMVHWRPIFSLGSQKKLELIFVLDRSGSMTSQTMALVKNALVLCLHSMPLDCFFNVIGFGSKYEFLFHNNSTPTPKSIQYSDESLQTALKHVNELDANLGASDILTPLQILFSLPEIPDHQRQLFVISDGEVLKTERVINLVKANVDRTRVFSVGIGNSASLHRLVDGIAVAGQGTSAFVAHNEAFDTKVLEQLKIATQPCLKNVKISWQIVPESDPVHLVTKFKTLLGLGKLEEDQVGLKLVKAETQKGKKPCSQTSAVAYTLLQEFQGLEFIAFEVLKTSKMTNLKGATITVDSAEGPMSIDLQISDENNVEESGLLHQMAEIQAKKRMMGHMEKTELHKDTKQKQLQQLVRFQSFKGHFRLENEFFKAIGMLDIIVVVIDEAASHGWDAFAWATVLALTFMKIKLSDLEQSWELVARKSRKWLQFNCKAGHIDSMFATAEKLYFTLPLN